MSPPLSLSTAVRAFVCGLLASFASAVTIELPLLRPPAVGEEGLRRLEDKPTGPDPRTCKIWQDCWKLTIPDTLIFLACFGVCIIFSFYTLNKVCCEMDDEEQKKRYEALKAQRRDREAQEAAQEAASMSRTSYQPAPDAPYGRSEPAARPYSQGGAARPYGR